MSGGARKDRLFTQEEVNAILSRAVERQSPGEGGLSYDEVVDVARQAGISAEAIDAAASEVESKRPVAREDDLVREELAARTWRARRTFALHLTSYVMVMALLAVANWLTWRDGDPMPWVLFPALGWGIGLASHLVSVLYGQVFPDPRREQRVRLELREREDRRRRKAVRGALKQSAKELSVAVERGMANVLADVARSIEGGAAPRDASDAAPAVRVGSRARVEDEGAGLDEDGAEDPQRAARRR